jgi:hypothetical protein
MVVHVTPKVKSWHHGHFYWPCDSVNSFILKHCPWLSLSAFLDACLAVLSTSSTPVPMSPYRRKLEQPELEPSIASDSQQNQRSNSVNNFSSVAGD